MKSLYGYEIDDIPPKPPRGVFKKWKVENFYRKSDGDKKCGNCCSFVELEHHNKTYFKCKLLGISNSEASDIRKSYVCNQHGRRTKQ